MADDETGYADPFVKARPPQRVVSLVPSITESLFELGLGEYVVGITDYCVYPDSAVRDIPKVGGPKDSRVDSIVALQPDLVLANKEENTRQTVESIRAANIQVWVSFPCTVVEAVGVLRKLAGIFQSTAALQRVEILEKAAEWALTAAIDQRPKRYFCPIWHDQTPDKIHWWMTFNQRSYSSDLLAFFGGKNIFHGRDRRFPLEADLGISTPQPPGERDTRYPRVCLAEIRDADPEVILLPDEPYKFDEAHHAFLVEQLSETQAVCNQMIYFIDGSLITWHGTRLAKALNELPAVFI